MSGGPETFILHFQRSGMVLIYFIGGRVENCSFWISTKEVGSQFRVCTWPMGCLNSYTVTAKIAQHVIHQRGHETDQRYRSYSQHDLNPNPSMICCFILGLIQCRKLPMGWHSREQCNNDLKTEYRANFEDVDYFFWRSGSPSTYYIVLFRRRVDFDLLFIPDDLILGVRYQIMRFEFGSWNLEFEIWTVLLCR